MKRLGMRCRYSCEEPWRPKDILVTSVCISGTLMKMRRGYTKSIEKLCYTICRKDIEIYLF